MTKFDYDLLVIGAGSGGVRAARVAAGHGARVAVAEEYRIGGTCVIRGCVPKKLLVYGAHFAEDLEDAGSFGWRIEGCTFEWKTLRDRVLAEVTRLSGLYTQTLTNHKVELLHGHATLTGAHTVRVGDRTVSAGHILIATGAHPHVPEKPGCELGITSNDVFHLEALPKRVVIMGAGYIANEFAGIFNQFGSTVTLVNRSDQILRGYDEQIRDRLMQISTSKGIRFLFNAQLEKVTRESDGELTIHLQDGERISCDGLLFATGRVPNTRGLGLEAAGVATDEKGAVKVDAASRTTCPTIYAVGDVTNRMQLTPVAIREGQAFADSVFGNKPTVIDYDCIPSAVFSHPPLAGVGLTESQARNRFGAVKVYTSDFRPMKNVLADRNERSLYKLVVDDSTDKVLGAHMIGPDAPEILQLAAVAVKAGLTKTHFDQCVAIHPTMAEEMVLLK
jgi:glutathione reductase (NADPH)